MPDVRLKFEGGEITPKEGVTTLGRTTDNDIAFPNDSNVSRYHAEIEFRDGEFCLIDLNSSNGTTVNGIKAAGETYLRPGDHIVLGGSSELTFEGPPEDEEEKEEAAAPVSVPPVGDAVRQVPGIATAAPASGSRTMLMIAGGAVLVAIVVVGVTGAIYYRSMSSGCAATAKILKPEPGETIYQPIQIEVDSDKTECVAKAVFTLDGREFASADSEPYTATLDPKEHPDLADGFDHTLGIVLIAEDGSQVPQGGVLLAMETREVEKPEERPSGDQPPQQVPGGSEVKGKEVSIIDVQQMTNGLVKRFSGNNRYNVSNKQFLLEVQKKAAEYAQEGYYDRAARYRDAINVAFVKEQNLDPALGYLLAMSRSRFDPQKQGAEEGLWRMNADFVKANAYDGLCGGQPISEPTQNCAAKAAALYMKAIVYGVFDGDPIYSAVAFGRSTADAAAWKATLPKDRSDVWNSIRTAPEREQLVRFFAAGIVAENPLKFGLKRDQPISGLYP